MLQRTCENNLNPHSTPTRAIMLKKKKEIQIR